MIFHDRFDNRQSQTGAGDFPIRIARPVEFIEHVRQVDRRNAGASIDHLQNDLFLGR